MLTYAELETFYLDLVSRARAEGVTCAITSGMACVHYGVAQTTKDCDLLCDPEAAERFLQIVETSRLEGVGPIYRGNLSPPMDKRWLARGWTSHFVWRTADDDSALLDVFGVPPRASSPWEDEIEGFYSSCHTVAEMKRTDRDKDWPYATALGEKMLQAGDERGWLHVFDSNRLLTLAGDIPFPEDMVQYRPTLSLLREGDADQLEFAIRAEKEFWHQLDSVRIGIMRTNVRPYFLAVREASAGMDFSFEEQHKVRVEIAEKKLPTDPLHGMSPAEAAETARDKARHFLPESAVQWLPDISAYSKLFVK